MTSPSHLLLVELPRERPSLASALVAPLGVDIPADAVAEVVDATFPASVADRRADLAIAFRTGASPRCIVILEVQLSIDPDKPRRWLTYQVAAQDRHRCEVVVLVVTPDRLVADWARRPIAVGQQGSYAPLVLGPAELPRPEHVPEGSRSPELILFLTVVHQRDADAASVRAAARALLEVSPARASLYTDIIQAIFKGSDAFARVMKEMQMEYVGPFSEWGKKHFNQGKAEGKAEGIAEGKAEGIAEGIAEGKAQGKADGLAAAVLGVLGARGIAVSQADRDRILTCTDVARLTRWVEEAVRVESAGDLLLVP